MTLTELALARSHFAGVGVAVLLLVGVSLFVGYPSQEEPDFTIREAVVSTRFPGMSPERIEDLVTRPIEEEIRGIPEVEHITSSSRAGISVVHVHVYDRYFDLEPIWSDLRDRMEDLAPSLPEGVLGPYVNDDFGRVAVATIAVTGDGFELHELHEVAKDLRQELYVVRGTSQVDLFGVQAERIFLDIDPLRLAEFGVGPAQIFDSLVRQNVVLPGGRVSIDGYEFLVEPSGNLESVDEIGEVPISLADGGVAYMRDLAIVERSTIDPPDAPVYYEGEPAIAVGVSMVQGENVVEYGERLREAVERFEQGLPWGYRLSLATFQPDRVERSISEFAMNLYQTVGVVLLVVILFLGLRTGLIVGLIVPLTILSAFVFMSLLEIPLHSVSIAALIISLGLLVDNGVVVAEDVRTRMEAGVERREAALAAGRELAMPLLTSSLTTILAFMPLMLAQNSAGEYTRSLSQVVAITLLCSWFLALYATPLFCTWFVRVDPTAGGEGNLYARRGYQVYRRFLHLVLRRRIAFLALMFGIFVTAIFLFRFVTLQFFPSSTREQYLVYFDLAAGADIRQTADEVGRFASWLRDPEQNPEVSDHIAYVGSGGPRFVLNFSPPDPGSHRAFFVVNVGERADVERALRRAREHLATRFPDVRARVLKLGTGPSQPGLVELRIAGRDRDELIRIAREIEDAFFSLPGVIEIRDDWENRTRKIVVEVNQARALRAGLSSEDIASSLAGAFEGSEISDYREEDQSIPIVVRSRDADGTGIDDMRTLPVYSNQLQTAVPLLQIAEFDIVWEYGTILRRDLERTVTVAARHPVWKAAELAAALQPALDEIEVPPGYRVEHGGELEASSEANTALFSSVPLCGAAIALLLVWQFNSVRRPLIIFLTIPLALIGAVAGLLLTGAPFGFMATLGLLSLAGIIINNAIVLIDRIDFEIAAGEDPHRAIVHSSMKRLRPILMTTLTTIFGLMPLMLFGGELWYGMAVVIAAGLGGGTVLTLGVVPVLYALLFRVAPPAAAEREVHA
ncbi:MAG: efflux RND transporter permease subunit [Myxococcota bacterium]|nr:efflux RND transporter permease subunit [Myxococcota bacterium]